MNLISMIKLMQSFQWVVFRNDQNSVLCEFIVFGGDFCNYLSGFLGRDIKQLCI